jgi:cell division protein FtsQ
MSGKRRSPAVPGDFGSSRAAEKGVLPRWLRRPVRLFARLGTGDFVPPRFAATIAAAALFASTGIYGSWVGGHMPAIAEALTSRSGFAVDEIRVVGHRQTSEIDIVERLELTGWTSLIGFDVEAARARIADLPWVETVAVRKIYPNAIEIRMSERDAFAIWQRGQELSVVDRQGRVIVPYLAGRHPDLPLVVGGGANERAGDILSALAVHPELMARVKAYVRVGDRRWNLWLDNGMSVKLPENGVDAALAGLVEMQRSEGVIGRDVASVDLRLADRVVLKLSPEASEARQAELAKRGKKPAGRRT